MVLGEFDGSTASGGVTDTVEVAVVGDDGIAMLEKLKEPAPIVTTVDV